MFFTIKKNLPKENRNTEICSTVYVFISNVETKPETSLLTTFPYVNAVHMPPHLPTNHSTFPPQPPHHPSSFLCRKSILFSN